MSNLSEEEIIKILENYTTDLFHSFKGEVIIKAIKGLLDLYNKEKEKNKLTANDIENFKAQAYMLGRKDENEAMKGVIERHYISKDKIKEKIEELKNEKDKYFEKQVIQGRIDLLEELLEGE